MPCSRTSASRNATGRSVSTRTSQKTKFAAGGNTRAPSAVTSRTDAARATAFRCERCARVRCVGEDRQSRALFERAGRPRRQHRTNAFGQPRRGNAVADAQRRYGEEFGERTQHDRPLAQRMFRREYAQLRCVVDERFVDDRGATGARQLAGEPGDCCRRFAAARRVMRVRENACVGAGRARECDQSRGIDGKAVFRLQLVRNELRAGRRQRARVFAERRNRNDAAPHRQRRAGCVEEAPRCRCRRRSGRHRRCSARQVPRTRRARRDRDSAASSDGAFGDTRAAMRLSRPAARAG